LNCSKEFFDLQIKFASRVAALAGIPLEQAILDYTNFYIRFALGRSFDPEHPVWMEYLAGLRHSSDHGEWSHRFFLKRPHQAGPPMAAAAFGCFSYAHGRDGYVRIHFESIEPDPHAPLGAERRSLRLSELRALFDHIKRTQEGVRRVAGVSWLYNLPAYRRLFPETYLSTAKIAGQRFRNLPLWGQFLDRRGAVRKGAATLFLERLSVQDSMEDLARCFPLQPLAVEAPISDFYEFHSL